MAKPKPLLLSSFADLGPLNEDGEVVLPGWTEVIRGMRPKKGPEREQAILDDAAVAIDAGEW